MRPPSKGKPDVLDALMSAPLDEEEEGAELAEPDMAVIAVEDEDEPEALEAEEGTPEAEFAQLRSGLDKLEQMFLKG